MRFDFSGKTVFVSGGTSGINLGGAKGFSGAGANVFTISRDPAKVEAAVAVQAAFVECVATFGEIDVLISGAAGNFPAKANRISSNGFRSVLEIDTLGTHHVMTAAFPHLKKPGASIINISAPQAFVPMIA